MKCYLCNGYHLPGESCSDNSSLDQFSSNLPSYDLPKINPDPIIPRYEPPSYDLPKINPDPILPRYEPPPPPPPMPVRDNSNSLIGHLDPISNQIKPINNMINGGMPLRVEGSFVRDSMGNLVGEMGPGNTMFPPPSFGPPKPGF